MLRTFSFLSHDIDPAAKEYGLAGSHHPSQVFTRPAEYINSLLEGHQALTRTEAWLGFKWKAEKPEGYIPAIESAIVPGSRKATKDGEFFTRLTIQPSFVTRKLVIVKEDIYIDESKMRIYFLGRPVDREEAKLHLRQFEETMLEENPALFHVEHAVMGDEENPVATWELIRLSEMDPANELEAKRIRDLREWIVNSKGTNIYLQTIRQLKSMQPGLN